MGYLTKKFKSDTILFDPIEHEHHFNEFCQRLPEMTIEERESWQREFRNWISVQNESPQVKRRNKLLQLLK